MYLEMGKFGVPAKHHEAIALIYSKVRHSRARTIDILTNMNMYTDVKSLIRVINNIQVLGFVWYS